MTARCLQHCMPLSAPALQCRLKVTLMKLPAVHCHCCCHRSWQCQVLPPAKQRQPCQQSHGHPAMPQQVHFSVSYKTHVQPILFTLFHLSCHGVWYTQLKHARRVLLWWDTQQGGPTSTRAGCTTAISHSCLQLAQRHHVCLCSVPTCRALPDILEARCREELMTASTMSAAFASPPPPCRLPRAPLAAER